MELKKLMVDTKSVFVPFDGVKGFEVEINYIPRTEMTHLYKSCQRTEFSKKTRGMETTLDEEKFVERFVDKAIKGWRGLTYRNLENFLPIDYAPEDADTELEFTKDNAILLVKESSLFDDFLNQKITDVDSFRRG